MFFLKGFTSLQQNFNFFPTPRLIQVEDNHGYSSVSAIIYWSKMPTWHPSRSTVLLQVIWDAFSHWKSDCWYQESNTRLGSPCGLWGDLPNNSTIRRTHMNNKTILMYFKLEKFAFIISQWVQFKGFLDSKKLSN